MGEEREETLLYLMMVTVLQQGTGVKLVTAPLALSRSRLQRERDMASAARPCNSARVTVSRYAGGPQMKHAGLPFGMLLLAAAAPAYAPAASLPRLRFFAFFGTCPTLRARCSAGPLSRIRLSAVFMTAMCEND